MSVSVGAAVAPPTAAIPKFGVGTPNVGNVLCQYPLVLLRIFSRTMDSTALWGLCYRIYPLVLYEGPTTYNEDGPNHVGQEHLYDIADQP